jgi:hypothetical protein
VLETKKIIEDSLLAIDGVVGVGLSGNMIMVYVERCSVKPLIPPRIAGFDVMPKCVGKIQAIQTTSPSVLFPIRTQRYRPAVGGISAGHQSVGAGTLGGIVRDTVIGEKLLISNNHVFANSDTIGTTRAAMGDYILQPGKADGGTLLFDIIGTLYRWVPLDENGLNLVDVALARPYQQDDSLQYMLADDDLNVIPINGAHPPIEVNTPVKKYSRTSGVDGGIIYDTDASVIVDFGEDVGKIKFVDQLLAVIESNPGDSGSLILDMDNNVVGLHFAASDPSLTTGRYYAIINKIGNVMAMLSDDLDLDFTTTDTELPSWANTGMPGEPPIVKFPPPSELMRYAVFASVVGVFLLGISEFTSVRDEWRY